MQHGKSFLIYRHVVYFKIPFNFMLNPTAKEMPPNMISIEEHSTLAGVWELLEQIGEGFSSQVFLARHSLSGIQAALKRVDMVALTQRYNQQDFNVLSRLRSELTILYTLQHPSIPRPLKFFISGNSAYLCMTYCNGNALSSVLEKHKKLSEDAVRNIMRQVLNIVDYIHSEDVCHGDIKLDNLIEDEETGSISVIDFGFSRRVETGREVKAIGITAPYAPPEAFLTGFISKGWDIWSSGVVMYVLLMGNFPFNFQEVEWNTAKKNPVDLAVPYSLSADAVQAMTMMFTVSILKRPTASQILQLPFFKKDGQNTDVYSGNDGKNVSFSGGSSESSGSGSSSFRNHDGECHDSG
tara:strand:- start:1233 stop:2291 length:1059 start_codon:yes stop_codon:yes gene_type:complete